LRSSRDPGNPVFRSELAKARRLERLRPPRCRLPQVVAATRGTADAWYNLAVASRVGPARRARSAVAETLRLDPGAPGHNVLASWRGDGNAAAARVAFERATALDPRDAQPGQLGNPWRASAAPASRGSFRRATGRSPTPSRGNGLGKLAVERTAARGVALR